MVICCNESENTTSAPPVGARSRERCSGTYLLTEMDEEITSKGRTESASSRLALQTELAAFQRLVSRAYQ